MRSKSFLRLLVGAIVFLAGYSAARGQTFYGSMVGTVSDATGAAIPGTAVTLTNLGTTVKRTIESDTSGSYQFVNLIPGRYRVEAEKAGFKHFTREPIVVEVQNALRIDIPMELGNAATQTVEVTAQTPLLQSSTSELGQVVEARKVTEMPLNGRNPLALVALVPGVVPQGGKDNSSLANPTGSNIFAWGNIQIGGGQANQSATFIDGGSVNTIYVHLLSLVPTQDSIQEFKVETNNLGPEWGKFAGGVINMTTKSGSNEFHGSAYEFLRNKVLNANDFFLNASGINRAPFTQNQFGANAGGRIIHEKLFFFGSYEGFRQRLGQAFLVTVPTDAMRTGDFSDLRDSSGNLIPIYDPLTTCGRLGNAACPTVIDPVTGMPVEVITRQQFSGNMIPQNRLDPTAKILSAFWAPPTLPGQQFTHINNFATAASVGGNNDQWTSRIDWNKSDKQRIFGRFTDWTALSLAHDPYKTGICQDRCQESWYTRQLVLDDVYSFSPTTILDVRLSYLRFWYNRQPTSLGVDLTTFAWPASLNSQVAWTHIPTACVTGYGDFWCSQGAGSGIFARDDNYSLAPSLTKIRGRHTLKLGGEIDVLRNNYAQSNVTSGIFNFDSVMTSVNPFNTGNTGNGFASFMLGYGNTNNGGAVQTPSFTAGQQIYSALYFSDTFQATSKLTLNLGLRWERPGPFSERFDRMIVLLPDAANPLAAPTGLPLKGKLGLVKSSDRASRTSLNPNNKMFAPRIGFAYRLNQKTVLRGGYGIFYLPNDVSWVDEPENQIINGTGTPWVTTLDGGITPACLVAACTALSPLSDFARLNNPFPGGIIQPPGRSPSFQQTFLGQGVNAPLPTSPYAYTQQFNFNIQRELPDGTLVDIAYAGSKGVHLPVHFEELDQMPVSNLSRGISLEGQVCNPFYRPCTSETDTTSTPFSPALITSGGPLASPTVSRGQLLRPFPQYQGVAIASANNRNSIYHSLQAKVEKRFKGGGSILASYTMAKLISDTDTLTGWLESAGSTDWGIPNNYDHRAERSLADFDVSQRLVVSYVLDLPIGKGQRYMSSAGGVAGKLVSGWGINGITTLQSGFPLFIGNSENLTHSFGGFSRPDNNGQSAKLTGRAQGRLDEWFNTSVFSHPPAFDFGNVPRTLPDVRNHGIDNFDFAIFKNTKFGPDERFGIQFRTEFFNTFNRTQFGYPGQTCCKVDQPSFGVVSSQANLPRLIQFALRFTF